MSIALLAAAALSLPPQESALHPDAARVEVFRGRAVLVDEGGEHSLARGEEHVGQGRVHLELGAGAEAGVSWPGRAGLHLWGPASLEWSGHPSDRPRAEGESFSSHELEIELFDLAWADFEVRRGHHSVRMPGGWRGTFDSGAFYLRGLPTGPTELRHHAGGPLALEWVGDPDRARPPVVVYPGSSLLLGREVGEVPRTEPRVGVWDARGWEETEWPWSGVSGRSRVALGAPAEPGERSPVASVPEFPELPPEVQVDVQPLEPEPFASEPFGSDAPDEPAWTAPQPPPSVPVEEAWDWEPAPSVPEPRTEPAPEPVATVPEAPRLETVGQSGMDFGFHAEQWRGLPRTRLVGAGAVAVERGAGVEVRVFPSGRRKVFVDASTPAPVWCFAPGVDYLMHPGSVAVFEPSGSLHMHFGTIDERPATPGRPEYNQLED